ncbi:7-cyano-7-deazaguanine synthase QueC [Massilia sp. W12]|uniref:7-cyano-7-deazaguanine synthase QueC n=1 Tax=Massilia sp. W12 TaxID=3126507 RepID=UPI0030D03D87
MSDLTSHPGRALVLFSGGQDSTTCLAWALQRYAHVETLGFDYGQRHVIELQQRPLLLQRMRAMSSAWDAKLGQDHLLDLGLLGQISDTALTSECAIKFQENGLPNTFVPGRNLLFLTLAATLAYRRGLTVLVGGMCETDYSGYPDCRDDTIKALQVALNLGMDTRLTLETPLMWLSKAATWRLAQECGGDALLELIRQDTHTCYLGERGDLHAWGHGCGACPACELRARGWQEYQSALQAPAAFGG